MTPFTLTTSDQESLYVWHILPLPLYYKNEDKMAAQRSGLSADITQMEAFELLRNDPDAKLIISCKYSPSRQNPSPTNTLCLVHGV